MPPIIFPDYEKQINSQELDFRYNNHISFSEATDGQIFTLAPHGKSNRNTPKLISIWHKREHEARAKWIEFKNLNPDIDINTLLNTNEQRAYLEKKKREFNYVDQSLEQAKEQIISLNAGERERAKFINPHPVFRNLFIGVINDTNVEYFYDNIGVLRALPSSQDEAMFFQYTGAVFPVREHLNSFGNPTDFNGISQIILNEAEFKEVISNNSINSHMNYDTEIKLAIENVDVEAYKKALIKKMKANEIGQSYINDVVEFWNQDTESGIWTEPEIQGKHYEPKQRNDRHVSFTNLQDGRFVEAMISSEEFETPQECSDEFSCYLENEGSEYDLEIEEKKALQKAMVGITELEFDRNQYIEFMNDGDFTDEQLIAMQNTLSNINKALNEMKNEIYEKFNLNELDANNEIIEDEIYDELDIIPDIIMNQNINHDEQENNFVQNQQVVEIEK